MTILKSRVNITSLICTIFSLSSLVSLKRNVLFLHRKNYVTNFSYSKNKKYYILFKENKYIYNLNILQKSSYSLKISLSKKYSKLFKKILSKNKLMKTHFIKQYLRKFSFYYKHDYVNHYPNNISFTSPKKNNMLGIKNLFLLLGL